MQGLLCVGPIPNPFQKLSHLILIMILGRSVRFHGRQMLKPRFACRKWEYSQEHLWRATDTFKQRAWNCYKEVSADSGGALGPGWPCRVVPIKTRELNYFTSHQQVPGCRLPLRRGHTFEQSSFLWQRAMPGEELNCELLATNTQPWTGKGSYVWYPRISATVHPLCSDLLP